MPWEYAGPTTIKQQGRQLYPLKPDLTPKGEPVPDTDALPVQQAAWSVVMPMRHTDGRTFPYTEPVVPDLARVPTMIANWLKQHNAVEAVIATPPTEAEIAAAVDAILNPPVVPSTPPTQAQRDRNAYQQAKAHAAELQELVALKAIAADDPAVVKAQVALAAAAQPILEATALAVDALAMGVKR